MADRVLTVEDLLSLRFPNRRAPMALSPDGRLLAICLQNAYGFGDGQTEYQFSRNGVATELFGSRILLVDTASGDSHEPFPPGSLSWAAQWSPVGDRLAAYVSHEGYPCLATWDAATRSVRLFRDVTVRPGMAFEVPCWTPDGRCVVVGKVDFPATDDKASDELGPLVWKHPSEEQGEGKVTYKWDLPYHVALVDVHTGAVRYLARDTRCSMCPVSPDGASAAAFRYSYNDKKTGEGHCTLDVVALDGAGDRTVASDVPSQYWSALSWSPDAREIAYIADGFKQRGRLFVVLADGSSEPRELTPEGVDLRRSGDWVFPPCWSADDSMIYCMGSDALWEFRSDGSSARQIMPETPVAYWLHTPLWGEMTGPDDESVFVIVPNEANTRTGLARMDLQTGSVSLLQEVDGEPLDPCTQAAVSPDSSTCYLCTYSPGNPAALWRIDLRADAKHLTSLSPGFSDLALGTSRTIEYQGTDGRTLQAGLLLPANYQEGERLPMVVEVYGGGGGPHQLGRLGRGALVVNPYLLAARGFAVLYPHIPLAGQDPYGQIPGPVLAAIEKAVDMGIADPDRLGVMGQSYGAYTLLSLITQTPLFKAAVCNAGMVNLVRMYTQFQGLTGADYTWYCETGQGGMGGTLWERRDAYIDNSPLFHLDRVTTPVLLTCGGKDPMGGLGQMQETFVGLRRLGKTAELRVYPGESHFPGAWSEANFRDFCTRVADWFDLHLGGKR